MRSKIGYSLAALVLLLGLIGPIVCSQKVVHQPQPPLQNSSLAEADSASPPFFSPSPTEESISNQLEEKAADLAVPSKESEPLVQRTESAKTDSPNPLAAEPKPANLPRANSPNANLPRANSPGQNNNATNQEALSNPADPGSPEQGLSVELAVVGRNGQLLYGPTKTVLKEDNRWGLSVLGALDSTGLSYQLSPKYGNFVLSIGGVTNQGSSGWMYQVNGQVPLAAADKQIVNPGDQIIWWFSESLKTGPPSWENLRSAAP
ncbi:MAG: DUF4430 domain-containing protein [Bacillota bacterium]